MNENSLNDLKDRSSKKENKEISRLLQPHYDLNPPASQRLQKRRLRYKTDTLTTKSLPKKNIPLTIPLNKNVKILIH
ncbi:hypothetical protein BCY91_07830 [Pelobium manganitolerans]|uniref:Uncharacterized protein n=1 Tax=Pelobium manganitolerans TaxID=1842495 RepID=A0A419S405_9SPHI|nr:hypothetical protein BCY91_07830 [Pelobium manganitolerans]